MDERSRCDLPYGHFGRGNYSLIERTWSFGRTLTVGEHLKFFEDAKPCQKSRPILPQTSKEPPNKRYPKQIKYLTQHCPEFQAAHGIITSLLKVSEAVEEAVRSYDPLQGSLLSFAQIRSAAAHKRVSIAACASGNTGCELRLVRVLSEKRSWEGDKNSWLELPSLSGEENSTRLEGPIQQVRFGWSSGGSGGNTVLAVRLLDKITIFQPSVDTAISAADERSSLQVQHLYSISAGQLNDQFFADAVFNPWFPQQVGVVTCTGAWQVYEFASRKFERIARSWRRPDLVRNSNDETLTDGWARLAWVGNLETLVVCTRTTLRLYSIAEEHAETVQNIDIEGDGGGGGATTWTLDFMLLSDHVDHFCVVTSQCLIIYQVEVGASLGPSCKLKARVRHFRNPEDLSLRLTSWTEAETIRILLYSSTDSRASVYNVKIPDLDQLLATDPVILTTWKEKDQIVGTFSRDLRIQPLSIHTKQASNSEKSALSEKLKDSGRFYAVTSLRDDRSVHEGLWHGLPLVGAEALPPSLELSSIRGSKTSSSRVQREQFIVDDDHVDTESPHIGRREPFARRTRRPAPQLDLSDTAINLEMVTEQLSTHSDTVRDLSDAISEITAAVVEPVSTAMLPLLTLTSFADSDINTGDVQDASQMLEDMIASRSNEIHTKSGVEDEVAHLHRSISNLTLPTTTGLDQELSGMTLSSVYERLVSRWISSLRPQVPGRIRLAKVETLRQTAAQLVLASRVIRVQDRKQQPIKEEAEDEGEPQRHVWELPMRSTEPSSSQNFFSSPPVVQASQENPFLPTPSPTATPSIATISSHPSSFAAPELFRLSRYTTFTKPSPSVLPRPLRNVLAHWKQDEDLDEYDWLSVSRHLSQRDEDDEDDMTEKERKRVQRRAERHIRRQRKEAAASQAQRLASSQAAEIFSASQPTIFKTDNQPIGVAGSSQSQAPGAFAASQVVPGRFGGRPPPKKKRKQGF